MAGHFGAPERNPPVMGSLVRFAAFASLALGAAPMSCHRTHEASDTARGGIAIGVITAITGTQAAFGQAHQRGYLIALEEINAAGGVLGRPLVIDTYDDQSKPDMALQGMSKLVDQDNVPVVIGSYSSESSLALVPTVTRKQVPLIVPSGTADNIVEQRSPWVFRLCAGSADYANAMADFLLNHGAPKTIAIVNENTNFGQSNALAMRKAAATNGMTVIDEEAYSAGSPSYSPMLQRVKEKKPDVVYFASYLLDATTLMRQSRQVDLNPRFFAAAGTGFSTAEFPTEDKGAGKDAEFTIATSQWVHAGEVKAARCRANSMRNSPQGMERHPARTMPCKAYYASLKVAVAAIQKAGKLDRTAVRDALKGLSLDSAFGPIHFAENGQNQHPVVVTQVQKGKYTVVVWPKDVAAAPVLDTPAWSAR